MIIITLVWLWNNFIQIKIYIECGHGRQFYFKLQIFKNLNKPTSFWKFWKIFSSKIDKTLLGYF